MLLRIRQQRLNIRCVSCGGGNAASIPKDRIEGCSWLMLADSRGYEDAGKILKTLLNEMDRSDVRRAKKKMMKRLA